MMNDRKWTELQQAEDMTYFKADLCCYSPESYSLEEKRGICDEMVSSSKAMLGKRSWAARNSSSQASLRQ